MFITFRYDNSTGIFTVPTGGGGVYYFSVILLLAHNKDGLFEIEFFANRQNWQ